MEGKVSLKDGVNTYATWMKGNPDYKLDIGGGFWKKLKSDKESDDMKTKINDKLTEKSTARFIGITGGTEDDREKKVTELTEMFPIADGDSPFHALTLEEERMWTYKSVEAAMNKITKGGIFPMVALGSTDLHIMNETNSDTYPNVGKKAEVKEELVVDKLITSIREKPYIWIAGSLSFLVPKGVKLVLAEGDVYITKLQELKPEDKTGQYNLEVLKKILGSSCSSNLVIGARPPKKEKKLPAESTGQTGGRRRRRRKTKKKRKSKRKSKRKRKTKRKSKRKRKRRRTKKR